MSSGDLGGGSVAGSPDRADCSTTRHDPGLWGRLLEGESTGLTSRPAGLGWSTAQRLSGAGGAERSRELGAARNKGKGDEGAGRWGRLVSRRQLARGLRK